MKKHSPWLEGEQGGPYAARFPSPLSVNSPTQLLDDLARIERMALPIKRIIFPVAMYASLDLTSHEAADAMPAVIEVDLTAPTIPDDIRGHLRTWFELKGYNADRSEGDSRSRWTILMTPTAYKVLLYIDLYHYPRLNELVIIPIQLVFDLQKPEHRRAVRRAADEKYLSLAVDLSNAKDEPYLAMIIEDQVYEQGSSVAINLSTDFYSMIQDSEFGILADPNMRPALWARLSGVPLNPAVEEISRSPDTLPADTPWTFWGDIGERMMTMTFGDRADCKVIFTYDPYWWAPSQGIIPGEEYVAWIPLAADDLSLCALPQRENDSRFYRHHKDKNRAQFAVRAGFMPPNKDFTPKLKPGWKAHGIICLVRSVEEDMWYWAWEYTIVYKSHQDVSPDLLLDMALASLWSSGLHTSEGSRLRLPLDFWTLTYFLARTANASKQSQYLWMRELWPTIITIEPLILQLWTLWAEAHNEEPPFPGEDSSRIAMSLIAILNMRERARDELDQQRVDIACIGLMHFLSEALWEEGAPAAADLMIRVREMARPGDELPMTLLVTSVSVLARLRLWVDDPPTLSPQVGDVINDAVLAYEASVRAWLQHLVLRSAPSEIPDHLRDWLIPKPFDLMHWMPHREITSSQERTGHLPRLTFEGITKIRRFCAQAESRAQREGIYPITGTYQIRLPRGMYPRLDIYDMTTLQIGVVEETDAAGRKPNIWVRFGPSDATGVVLPFVPGAEPYRNWQLMISHPVTWELHLALMCWYVDMRTAGEQRVLEPVQRQETPSEGPRRRGRDPQRQPSKLYVPRRTVVKQGKPSGIRPAPMNYGTCQDRAEIERRVMSAHNVPPHFLGAGKRKKFDPTPAKLEAWNRLDETTRILINHGSLDFPEGGTIRGLRIAVDEHGREYVELGYQRGGRSGEIQPRPVVARSLEAGAALLKIINEESR